MTGPPDSGAESAIDRLRAADRVIAVIGAVAYVQSQWPSAEQVWGDTRQPPVPDDLDGVWRDPGGKDSADRWIAVTATACWPGSPTTPGTRATEGWPRSSTTCWRFPTSCPAPRS